MCCRGLEKSCDEQEEGVEKHLSKCNFLAVKSCDQYKETVKELEGMMRDTGYMLSTWYINNSRELNTIVRLFPTIPLKRHPGMFARSERGKVG